MLKKRVEAQKRPSSLPLLLFELSLTLSLLSSLLFGPAILLSLTPVPAVLEVSFLDLAPENVIESDSF